tara:strand:+ start:1581 stop:5186 length:3606 start_codon:yes stop_codon:yes gene_type:complete
MTSLPWETINSLLSSDQSSTLNSEINELLSQHGAIQEPNLPSVGDDFFSHKLSTISNFDVYKSIDSRKEVSTLDTSFKRTAIQNIVRRFIHPLSLYSGLLLWHGVGVGKTCAALQVAELYKNICNNSGKKIWIISSPAVRTSWMNELFNLAKEKRVGDSEMNVQCTGSEYSQIYKRYMNDKVKDETIEKNIRKYMNQFYEFKGYGSFASLVDSIISDAKNEAKTYNYDSETHVKKRLRFYFSQTLIIVDEAHSIRPQKLTERTERTGGTLHSIRKISIPAGYSIILHKLRNKSSDKTTFQVNKSEKKIVLQDLQKLLGYYPIRIQIIEKPVPGLGFEPVELIKIFDKNDVEYEMTESIFTIEESSKRIYSVLEKIASDCIKTKMLLLTATPMFDDKKEIIHLLNLLRLNDKQKDTDINEVFGQDGNDDLSLLQSVASGYISFMRGGINPLEYPIKLVPVDAIQLLESDKSKNEMKCIQSELSDHQFTAYLAYKESISSVTSKSENIPNFINICKIVFPGTKSDKPILQTKLFNSKFIYDKANERYTEQSMENEVSMFHPTRLSHYSPKFHKIMESIESCEGIVFVYSESLGTGAISMSLILEQNGYSRLHKVNRNWKRTNMTTNVNNRDSAKTYMYLDYNDPRDMQEAIKRVRGEYKNEQNTNGEYVKVIIGTLKIAQGVSFKNVRQIHIIEPWHNLSRLEQIVGRGSRRNSHIELPEEKRNVTVFYHMSVFSQAQLTKMKKNQLHLTKTSDQQRYLLAYSKNVEKKQVEEALVKVCIDCFLNREKNELRNTIRDFNDDLVRNVRKIKDSFGEYKLNFSLPYPSEIICKEDTDIEEKSVDYSYFAVDDHNLIDTFILEVLTEFCFSPFTIDEIITKHPEMKQNLTQEYLHYIISTKQTIYNRDGISGLLQSLDHANSVFYMFVPNWSSNSLVDYKIPLQYRLLYPTYKKNGSLIEPNTEKEEYTLQTENEYDIILERVEALIIPKDIALHYSNDEQSVLKELRRQLYIDHLSEHQVRVVLNHSLHQLEKNMETKLYKYVHNRLLFKENAQKPYGKLYFNHNTSKLDAYYLSNKPISKYQKKNVAFEELISSSTFIGFMDKKNAQLGTPFVFRYIPVLQQRTMDENRVDKRENLKGRRCGKRKEMIKDIILLYSQVHDDKQRKYESSHTDDLCLELELLIRYLSSMKKNIHFLSLAEYYTQK